MDYRTYFRLSLLLPFLAIGAIELGFVIYGEGFTDSLPLFVASLWVESKAGMQIGWIEYGVLGAFLAWGLGEWPLRRSLLNGTLAPIYYAVLVLVSLFVYGSLAGDPTAKDAGVFVAVFTVTYGYMYVAVVLAGYFVLRELGAVRD